MIAIKLAHLDFKYRWVEGVTEILTEDGRTMTIAYRTNMIPGLAVTYSGWGWWSITHEGCGRKLQPEFRILEQAIKAVEENCFGLDWVNIPMPGENEPHTQIPAHLEEANKELIYAAMAEEDAMDFVDLNYAVESPEPEE